MFFHNFLSNFLWILSNFAKTLATIYFMVYYEYFKLKIVKNYEAVKKLFLKIARFILIFDKKNLKTPQIFSWVFPPKKNVCGGKLSTIFRLFEKKFNFAWYILALAYPHGCPNWKIFGVQHENHTNRLQIIYNETSDSFSLTRRACSRAEFKWLLWLWL